MIIQYKKNTFEEKENINEWKWKHAVIILIPESVELPDLLLNNI